MKKIYIIALILLTVLTLLSLALNGVIIFTLLKARRITLDASQTARITVDDARSLVTGIGDDTFAYTLHVDQEIPITTSIPFDEEVIVPIHTTVPISTVVMIPIRAGLLGTFDVDVPIHTAVPINLEVAVPISQTVSIDTTVPLDMDVPIEIPFAETPLMDYTKATDTALAQLQAALVQLEEQLANPFGGKK